MSRIGKLLINVPKTVTISLVSNQIAVTGPIGQLVQKIPKEISVDFSNDNIFVFEMVFTFATCGYLLKYKSSLIFWINVLDFCIDYHWEKHGYDYRLKIYKVVVGYFQSCGFKSVAFKSIMIEEQVTVLTIF
jgi:hypothetical protein